MSKLIIKQSSNGTTVTRNNVTIDPSNPMSDCFGTAIRYGSKVVINLRHGTRLGFYLGKTSKDQPLYLVYEYGFLSLTYANYSPYIADWSWPSADKELHRIQQVLSDIRAQKSLSLIEVTF